MNMEVAAAGDTEVVRSKRKTMKALNLTDSIEDMLITLDIVLDKNRANLGMARHQLTQIEKQLVI